MVKLIYWLSFLGILFAYIGYPMMLVLINKVRKPTSRLDDDRYIPSVSLIIPVHNEEHIIREKLHNIFQLDYPEEKLELIIVSDDSTDKTKEIVNQTKGAIKINYFELPRRMGKAAALNMGIEKANAEIVIFSDASIMLDRQAILNIVKQFQNEMVGCVSGEDHIREDSGEGAYGRYELFLRNQESRIYSIVGASGSFYAQRKSLCTSFIEGMAPDFLSVLNVAEQGYRSVTEPSAFGEMTSVKSMKNEFQRKVRTFIRGMSALFLKKRLMNPFKYGVFSILLISHKLIRWLVPCFLLILLVTNIFILEQVFYQVSLCAQVIFYLLALIAYMNEWLQDKIYGKIPLYFTIVNLAIIIAWFKYLVGVRQEIWNPSDRKV